MTAPRRDTIYALSSGSPPAAIAIVRISGPEADAALQQLAGSLPEPRVARLAGLCDPRDQRELDRALILRFPRPNSVTGEDIAELHLHGGRSVVAAVMDALHALPGLRGAEPGEFTRRAFENGRIDLAEAEGLADLLAAETESQRRAALAMAGGSVSRMVEAWQTRLLDLSARLEAALDFSDEDDVGEELPAGWSGDLAALFAEIGDVLARPSVERLHEGVRIVLAGPPNSGKSSLLNALTDRDAAIVASTPGTTRDLIEAPASIAGIPLLFVDTAGLRDSDDEVEQIGVGKAKQSLAAADLILWLGDPGDCAHSEKAIMVRSKCDLDGVLVDPRADVHVSAVTRQGVDRLIAMLLERANAAIPQPGEVAVNARHRQALGNVYCCLAEAQQSTDLLVASECLRHARSSLDRVTGRSGVEELLDVLFGRFCVGK